MAPIVADKNFSEKEWEPLGFGGFGFVYKARHKDRGEVAVKILRDNISPFIPLCDEAKLMNEASSKYVVQCYGIYSGCLPAGGPLRHGIVMEYMERGSVRTLQEDLPGPPPWPLVFRWAFQVAQSLMFLHSQNLVHQDIKPSNILLDADLNAKLGDFGLTRISTSVLKSETETKQYSVGAYMYKPPEAFEETYTPKRPYDIYSYGILLWSFVIGDDPYEKADYRRVKVRVVHEMDRPHCKKIEQMESDGLKELVDLMKKCWDHSDSKRPSSAECFDKTEKLFSKHKNQVHKAVSEVMEKLDSKTGSQHTEISVPPQTTDEAKSDDTVDRGRFNKTDTTSRQDPVSGSDPGMSNEQKGCSDVTDNLFSSKKQVHEAASQVSTKPASKASVPSLSAPIQTTEQAKSDDIVDSLRQDPVSRSDTEMSNKEKADYVDENRGTLIKLVSEVMAIIEELRMNKRYKNMVHSEAYSRIKSKDTNEDRMRELYDSVLHSGVVVVKAAFYDALKIHHPMLV